MLHWHAAIRGGHYHGLLFLCWFCPQKCVEKIRINLSSPVFTVIVSSILLVADVMIAVGAVIGIYGCKVRKNAQHKLGIGGNATKPLKKRLSRSLDSVVNKRGAK